ncbi:MAG: sulfite exporter TauE/SafE family protein [Myxococcales bacterium]
MSQAIFAPVLTGVGLAVALGLHCTLMCGPIAASTRALGGPSAGARYVAGRFVSYTLLGSLAGSVGRALVASPWANAAQLVASALFAALLLKAVLTQFGRAPARRLIPLRTAPRKNYLGSLLARVAQQPLLLGLATALIPCGALLMAVTAAATLGDPVSGALAMATFAGLSSLNLWLAARFLGPRSEVRWQRWLATSALLAGLLIALWRPYTLLTATQPSCHAHHSSPWPGFFGAH